MPVRLYETLFLLDATKVAADPDAARNNLHALLERNGGEVVVTRPWDENRKLAYPIKKQKKGYYQAVYYRLDSLKQGPLERDFALAEIILRQLTSVIDPKWEEQILDVARNDHTSSFALRGMQDDAAPLDVTPNFGPPGGLASAAAAEAGGEAGGPRGPRGPRRETAGAEKPE